MTPQNSSGTVPAKRATDSGEDFLDAPLDPLRYDGHRFVPDEVVARLCQVIPIGSRVLDVGCGTGSVSHHLAHNTAGEYMGIEPDPRRAEAARQRGLTVVDGYLSPSTFETLGLFDVIVFADVLEHLSDPGMMIDLAKNGLKPGGVIVISVPNVAHWSVRLSLLAGNWTYQPTGIMDATHLRWFTQATVRKLLESHDMRCVQILPTAGITLPVYFQRPWRWIPGRIRIRLIRMMTRLFPRLMACQFVVSATAK